MREEFKDLLAKITNPTIFTLKKWYDIPKGKNNIICEFIIWYKKETGNIEYSDDLRQFRVKSYTTNFNKNEGYIDNL